VAVSSSHVDKGKPHGHRRCVCGCASDALCPLCLDGRFSQLKGVAACRGERWADDVAVRVTRRDQRWPTDSDKVLAIARMQVADLTRDPRLLEMLAGEALRWAARRWNQTAATASASS
jgi:hypothetical protein